MLRGFSGLFAGGYSGCFRLWWLFGVGLGLLNSGFGFCVCVVCWGGFCCLLIVFCLFWFCGIACVWFACKGFFWSVCFLVVVAGCG